MQTEPKSTPSDQESETYKVAKKRVKRLRLFYTQLLTYAFVNILLITINVIFSPGDWWFYWVALFWGLGLGIQAIGIYAYPNFLGSDWEEAKITELMNHKKK